MAVLAKHPYVNNRVATTCIDDCNSRTCRGQNVKQQVYQFLVGRVRKYFADANTQMSESEEMQFDRARVNLLQVLGPLRTRAVVLTTYTSAGSDRPQLV